MENTINASSIKFTDDRNGLEYLMLRAVFLALICSIAGCSTARFSSPLESSSTRLSLNELSDLRARLLVRWHEIDQVRVLMRGQLISSDERQSLKAALVWSAPDRLRLETFPAVGAYSLTLLVADGMQARFLDYRSKNALIGDDQKTIGEILGVEVRREELVGALLGRVSESVLSSSDLVAYRESASQQIVLLWDGNKRWTRIDPNSGLVIELAYGDAVDGALVLSVENNSSFETNGVHFPAEVSLRAREREFTLELSIATAKFSNSLSDQLFRIEIPADFEVQG